MDILDLKGIAPDATGGESSEDFVARIRHVMDKQMGVPPEVLRFHVPTLTVKERFVAYGISPDRIVITPPRVADNLESSED
jgi:hypothetical protein